jgi:hypothetical protein
MGLIMRSEILTKVQNVLTKVQNVLTTVKYEKREIALKLLSTNKTNVE